MKMNAVQRAERDGEGLNVKPTVIFCEISHWSSSPETLLQVQLNGDKLSKPTTFKYITVFHLFQLVILTNVLLFKFFPVKCINPNGTVEYLSRTDAGHLCPKS